MLSGLYLWMARKLVLGLSAREVAEGAGISLSRYYECECGHYPTEEIQEKICSFYRGKGVFMLVEDVFPKPDIKTIPQYKIDRLQNVSDRLLPHTDECSEANPEYSAVQKALSEKTSHVLGSLSRREEKILRMRFGLGERYGCDYTLEEVGMHFNKTREKIRQIEAKALRKLRHPSRAKKLKPFAED